MFLLFAFGEIYCFVNDESEWVRSLLLRGFVDWNNLLCGSFL